MDKSELAEILDFAIIDFDRPWQVDDFMKTTVYAGMARLRGILDVVHYHGFELAERTSGWITSIASFPGKAFVRRNIVRLSEPFPSYL